MLNRMALFLVKQVWEKKFTNPFPVAAMPDSMTDALQAAEEGKIDLNPPVDTGDRFRGRLNYDKAKCIGCKLCIKVCPANAMTFLPEEKKILNHVDRCCFCAQCVEICPVKCLAMSGEFLISSYDRKAQIVTDTGKIDAGAKEEEGPPKKAPAPKAEVKTEVKTEPQPEAPKVEETPVEEKTPVVEAQAKAEAAEDVKGEEAPAEPGEG